ncbi:MAG: DNA-binding protein [Alphaproteobacteria bacterium]|nr:DNA-binding protein [Alphaproteobacteria bacterium]
MQHQIPESPDALLTREATAAALTASGFPIKAKTLATKATRGGSPPFSSFGARVLYRWGDSLAWAKSRLSPPLRIPIVPATYSNHYPATVPTVIRSQNRS